MYLSNIFTVLWSFINEFNTIIIIHEENINKAGKYLNIQYLYDNSRTRFMIACNKLLILLVFLK